MNCQRNIPIRAFALILVFCLLYLVSHGQQRKSEAKLFQLWKNVYQYELKGLPKSASQVVDSIYQISQLKGYDQQKLKAVIYQSKFMLILDENGEDRLFQKLKSELSASSGLEKYLLHSYTASVYEAYKDKNQWKIRSRKEVTEESEDYKTWTLRRLHQEIEMHYQASISNIELLQGTNISEISALVTDELNSNILRPTVYDLLCNRTIDFYLKYNYYLPDEYKNFEINSTTCFDTEVKSFGNQYAKTYLFKALLLLEKLSNYHLEYSHIAPFIDVTLQRFKQIKQHASFESLDKKYLRELEKLKSKYTKSEYSTLIDYEIAQVYFDQGMSFSQNDSDRLKLKKAREVCLEAEAKFPNSLGVQKCAGILNKIDALQLNIQTENYIPTNTRSKLFVNYKNIDSLSVSIYDIDDNFIKSYRRISEDSITALFHNKKEVSNESFALIDDLDFQTHSSEIPLPKLPTGTYFIITSSIDDSGRNINSYGFIRVTNIALVFVTNSKFQLIDRLKGAPLADAQISLYSDNGNHFEFNYHSDKNGFFNLKPVPEWNYYVAKVKYNKDSTVFDNIYVYQNRKGNQDKEAEKQFTVKPALFTDRAIYRPGQTIYFKGILAKQQGDIKELVKNEWVDVYLEDPNYNDVGEYFTLRTNEFGSFSGEFKLPKKGLTGEYTIYVEEGTDEDSDLYDEETIDFDYIEHIISVEEYKRPKFSVNIDPIDTTYSLGDSVSITGKAMAFAGSSISNAEINYTVSRHIQYPSWYYWDHGYRSGNRIIDIASGKSKTKGDGSFIIDFFAIPDATVDRKNLPVFVYQLAMDVTDINGETRSAQTDVNIGYHQYELSILAPDKVDIDKKLSISFQTTNLNKVKVPAMVEVEIYKEQYSTNVLRNRPWSAPDRPIMSENEFRLMFPHEKYSEKLKEKKGKILYHETINTLETDSLVLDAMQHWEQGNYIISALIEDSTGLDVVSKKLINAYSSKNSLVGDNQAFVMQKDKSAYKSDDKVKLTVGSAATELFVTLYLYVDNRLLDRVVTRLQNDVKSVEFQLPKSVAKSARVYYTYSFMNDYQSGSIELPIIKKLEGLNIETKTFRDRLIPGADETWSFTISDVKNKLVKAELLASMYDQSLDEFKTHTWRFIDFDGDNYYYYGRLQLNGRYAFGTKDFTSHNKYEQFRKTYKQRYSGFKQFGFNFRNPENAQKRYLGSIEIYREKESKLLLDYDSQIKEGFIHGKVVDENGDGIPGVTIKKKGTTSGTITDMQGDFSLEIKKGEVLQTSFIGYVTQDLMIGEYNKIEIQLTSDIQNLEEVVVVGYSAQEKKSLTGSMVEVADEVTAIEEQEINLDVALEGKASGINISNDGSLTIRGNNAVSSGNDPIYVVDGIIVEAADIAKSEINSLQVLKGAEATAIYGARAANGVVIISTKSGQNKLAQEMALVKTRSNLKETAFFYPHITAKKNGEFEFKFTTPESLTRWRLQLLAHDSKLQHGYKSMEALAQKDLMVFPNPPRFLRQGDEITLQAKVANLTSEEIAGQISLLLINPMYGKAVDQQFKNQIRTLPFNIKPNGNTTVSWGISIPYNFDLIQYKIVAKSDKYSDGESQVLPILSNRQLITESLPVWANGNENRTFELKSLKSDSSSTFSHHKLTFEMTEDPTWYAIQSLPYLIEFPHECAEQTFARYYANILSGHILNSNPKIKTVLDKWRADGSSSKLFEQNEQLKSILIEETPWLRDAQTEAEKNKRLSALLEFSKTEKGAEEVLNKLFGMKEKGGGYPWFSGGSVSRTITQHIVAGFGHLNALDVDVGGKWKKWTAMSLISSVKYVERELDSDYQDLLERVANKSVIIDSASFLKSKHISFNQIHGLYARSFYDTITVSDDNRVSSAYFIDQAEQYWIQFSLYEQAMIALIMSRNSKIDIAKEIMASIKENSSSSEEFGVYWKSNKSGWHWYQSPIETQALLIEAFHELLPEDQLFIEKMKVWLLRNKQTISWPTTKSTTDAVYALLISNYGANENEGKVEVIIGEQLIESSEKEAGTGYYTVNWSPDEIQSYMANVSLSNTKSNTVWGALYWQYFEDLDHVNQSNSSWSIQKQVLLKTHGTDGALLEELSDSVSLLVGDLVTVRLIIKTDRNAKFVHLKDQRAAGFEPIDVLSAYKWQDGLGYYQSTRDTGTHFFFDILKKGTYVFDYDLRVNNAGQFSNGIATLQSMYAPEFSGHSNGINLFVK